MTLDGLLERGIAAHGWIEADVLFEAREVHQHAIQLECGNPVTDDFGCAWRRLADGAPDLLEQRALPWRESGDVCVDVRRLHHMPLAMTSFMISLVPP